MVIKADRSRNATAIEVQLESGLKEVKAGDDTRGLPGYRTGFSTPVTQPRPLTSPLHISSNMQKMR
jgi:hypothetical protein